MPSSDRTEHQGNDVPYERLRQLTGRRAAPSFSPASTSDCLPNRPPPSRRPEDTSLFPPLNQQNGARPQQTDRILEFLTGFIGTSVTISTKSGLKYEGVVSSTGGEGDGTGVTLKDVKEISIPGAPLKDSIFIASTNIYTWSSGPANAKGVNKGWFKTETDDIPNPAPGVTSGTRDDIIGNTPKRDTPRVPIHGLGGLAVAPQVLISNLGAPTPAISTGDGITSAFRDFVSAERQRLVKKKAAPRVERDKLTSDLAKFSQTFKLKKPTTDGLVATLVKDEEKQKLEEAGSVSVGQANTLPSTFGNHNQ